MGQAVAQAALAAGDVRIKGRVDRVAVPAGVGDGAQQPAAAAPGDVVVDFSSPDGARAAVRLCATSGAALVSGTTGLDAAAEAEIRELARTVAVLRASNFSLGVLALRRAVAAALQSLPADWDAEIIERHHRRKVDAPSGTALTLAREIGERRGIQESSFVNGHAGQVGARPAEQIGLHAVRAGNLVGDHTVVLAGGGEWLELRHVAQDRSAFANGVIHAARFVAKAGPGLYHLEDLAS